MPQDLTQIPVLALQQWGKVGFQQSSPGCPAVTELPSAGLLAELLGTEKQCW